MALHQRKIQKKPLSDIKPKKPSSIKKPIKQDDRARNMLIIVATFAATVLFGWLLSHYETTKLYKPFPSTSLAVDVLKDVQRDNEMLWGTYRSHLYFGMKTRTKESLLFGLLWFSQFPKSGQLQLRYTCEQSDNLPKYGWQYHDGKTFGIQEIVDEDFILTTEFIKLHGGTHGGDWTARFKAEARNPKDSGQVVSLLYALTNEGKERIFKTNKNDQIIQFYGETKTLGHYKIRFQTNKGKFNFTSYLSSYEEDIYNVKDAVLGKLQYKKVKGSSQKLVGLSGDKKDEAGRDPNFFVYQMTFALPFEVDVIFESEHHEERVTPLTGSKFTAKLQTLKNNYDNVFEEKFNLFVKGFPIEQQQFAKAALSNMIGGIGYFYGESKVISSTLKEPTNYWSSALYTGVPSRSFFPRGFLWDEGFHQLLIQAWDPTITYDSIAHWLDLLNYHGWIPREQILGVEARRKVPDEFVVQHSKNANPPTFFLTIEALINREKAQGPISAKLKGFLKHIYPRLDVWFQWYNHTQKGDLRATYRWHGREEKNIVELNAKTLTSGLDDYPRASHPSNDERHVDLYCWIALAAGILADIGDLIGEDTTLYRNTERHLKDNELLDKLHWSDELQSYADYGNHTKFVKLEWVRMKNRPNAPRKLIRVDNSKSGPTLRFVGEFGYISLFPFLLRILNPHSAKLGVILKDIRDPAKIWTNYGLRSLSKSASMYNKHNTEHDKPYWRGPIWMNINFLAVKALHYYSQQDGPYKEDCSHIYKELRDNLIHNVFSQYKKTGYIWEQYDDSTGKGQGCYPFTGWSALVTLIMADNY